MDKSDISMERSYYDELHDKYEKINTTKKGTRYERLAALVFKKLDESGTVIHDLKLLGESGTESQIDVVIDSEEGRKRTIIECKDLDASEKDVGIDIVRCFWAVVDDLKPDKGIILTCNGFTKNARVYAKHKGIKLAILRRFLEAGLISGFNITIKILEWANPQPLMFFHNRANFDKWNNDLNVAGIKFQDIFKGNKPIYFHTSEGRYQINEYLDKLLNAYPRDKEGHVEYDVPVEGLAIEIEERGRIPIAKLTLKFDIVHSELFYQSVSDKIVELVLQFPDEEDLLIFDDDLKKFAIDLSTGEVIPTKG
jgi:hypothetical protein